MGLLQNQYQGQFVVFPIDSTLLCSSEVMSNVPVLAAVLDQRTKASGCANKDEFAIPGKSSLVNLRSSAELELFLQQQLGAVLRRAPSELDRERSFTQFGLESLAVLQFKNRLESVLGVILPATVVWKHPTIRALAKCIEQEIENRSA
jgi:acyl carrier protein